MTTRDWGVFRILVGDCRESLRSMPAGSAQCCVTSPPYYGLRDYGHVGQIGLEATPAAFVAQMVEVFRDVRRVLADDGVLWLNLGDSYAGTGKSGGGAQGKRWDECGMDTEGPRGGKWMPPPVGMKPKDLMGIPWRVAFALQADGWYLRQDIIWHKPNPMPESVTDRCTKAHEYLFLLSKSERYYWDADAMQEPATGQIAGNRKQARSVAEDPEKHRTRAGLPMRADRQRRKRGATPGKPDHTGLDGAARGETRNRRSVWTVAVRPFKGAHFATYPPGLIEPCVLSSSRPGDVVLDPFGGAGTTALVATQHGRVGVLCELNPAYADLAERRIATARFGSIAFGDAA